MPTLHSVREVVAVLEEFGSDLYVRWSKGPEADVGFQSRDDLTGVSLPGLSASALAVEEWWKDNELELWVARRLYDYGHLRERRKATPWLLVGEEVGRGPDNEPLVTCKRPIAWVGTDAIAEAAGMIDELSAHWGTLDRL